MFISPHLISGMPKDTPVLLGLSGGADSTALLHMLLETGAPVECAHINHMIRGDEAMSDEEFCRALCKRLGVPLHVLRFDVPELARSEGMTLEEAARLVRYGFFSQIMTERGIPLLATAHNANDNLETILLKLTRGSGARGVAGIPPMRKLDAGICVRPILTMSREEIIEYCEKNSLTYVTDSTNFDTEYSRNLIRAEITPRLLSINPALLSAATRFSELMREDEALLSGIAADFLEKSGDNIKTDELLSLPPSIARRVIAEAAARSGAGMLEYVHISTLLRMCERPSASMSLPGRVTAVISSDRLIFLRDGEEKAPFSLEITEKITQLPYGGYIIIEENPDSLRNIYNLVISQYINLDKIKSGLRVRSREVGDRILSRGMHKSVKKLMCDKRIPSPERQTYPIVEDGDGILWIPGVALRDGASEGGGAYICYCK